MRRLLDLKTHLLQVAVTIRADSTISKQPEWVAVILEPSFQWQEIELLVLLLEPFTDATTIIQGDSYPTSSRIWPYVVRMQRHLEMPIWVETPAIVQQVNVQNVLLMPLR